MKHLFEITLQASDNRSVIWKGQELLDEVSHGAHQGEPDGHTVSAIIDVENDIYGIAQEFRLSGAAWRAVEGLGALNDLIRLAVIDADEARVAIDLIERTNEDFVFMRAATLPGTVSHLAYSAEEDMTEAERSTTMQSGLWELDSDFGDGEPVTDDMLKLERDVAKVHIVDMVANKLQAARRLWEADILKDRMKFIAAQVPEKCLAHIAATAHLPKPAAPKNGA